MVQTQTSVRNQQPCAKGPATYKVGSQRLTGSWLSTEARYSRLMSSLAFGLRSQTLDCVSMVANVSRPNSLASFSS